MHSRQLLIPALLAAALLCLSCGSDSSGASLFGEEPAYPLVVESATCVRKGGHVYVAVRATNNSYKRYKDLKLIVELRAEKDEYNAVIIRNVTSAMPEGSFIRPDEALILAFPVADESGSWQCTIYLTDSGRQREMSARVSVGIDQSPSN